MYHSINGIPASFTIPKFVLKMYNVLGPMSPEKSPVLALESPGSISLALHDTCGPPLKTRQSLRHDYELAPFCSVSVLTSTTLSDVLLSIPADPLSDLAALLSCTPDPRSDFAALLSGMPDPLSGWLAI